MQQANRLRVISFLVEQAGVQVPLQDLPEVLGPNWFELDTLDSPSLTPEDGKVLTSCLAETLLGEPWPDDASPPEHADFLMRLQTAALSCGWRTETEVAITALENEWGMDIWRGLFSVPTLPDSATLKRALGYNKKVGKAASDRTGEVLNWYSEISGVVLSEGDLGQLPAMSEALRGSYRRYGLEHDTPDHAAMRAQSLALWLLDEPWPETRVWEQNRVFVARLQTAALSEGLRVEPERWCWDTVRVFQESGL